MTIPIVSKLYHGAAGEPSIEPPASWSKLFVLMIYPGNFLGLGRGPHNIRGLPTVRGKKLNIQKSSLRGKQKSAQCGISADPSQRGNDISAVHGKINQSRKGDFNF